MRKLLLLLVLFPFIGQSQNGFKVIEQTATYVVLEYKLGKYELKPVISNNRLHHEIQAEGLVPMLQKGKPELYKASIALTIPETGNPTVELIEGKNERNYDINILPSKGSLKRNVDPKSVALEYDKVYLENDFFPSIQETLGKPFILRNKRGVVLSINPFAYNPVSNTLIASTSIKVKVNFNLNEKGLNEMEKKPVATKEEEGLYQNKFINYNQVAYTPIAEQGSMLVICGDNFLNTMTPFVAWKNQKGIKTILVPVSQIGNDETSLLNYIQTYYSANPDLLYLLFVGDHAEINAGDAGMAGSETKWSDTYYTFLNGADRYPELFVGRFSGSTTAEIQTMVERTLEYEKNPSQGNWYSKAIGIGSDEGDGFGDDGEADWLHERNMGEKLLNWGYTTFHEFFDGSHGGNDAAGDPTPAMVSAAVDDGVSLFMYTGHGWDGGCVTSNYTSTEVQSATNGGKYPFVISVACNNGTFTSGTCFAEEFMLARNSQGPTGAIACSGSSILMAWAEPMAVQDEIVEILTDQYANNKKTTLGGLFYNGGLKMLDDYANATAEEVMETWVLFGDPSCVIRSKVPTQISANHNACYTIGDNSFTVNSSDEGAFVALSMNDTLLGTSFVQGGTAIIPFNGASTSPLTITISAYNKIPYQATASPCVVGLSDVSGTNAIKVFPNPAHNIIDVEYPAKNYSVKVIDQLGRSVYEEKVEGNKTTIDVSRMAKGVYSLVLSSENQTLNKKIVIE